MSLLHIFTFIGNEKGKYPFPFSNPSLLLWQMSDTQVLRGVMGWLGVGCFPCYSSKIMFN